MRTMMIMGMETGFMDKEGKALAVTTTFTATTPGEGPCWAMLIAEDIKDSFYQHYRSDFDQAFDRMRQKARLSLWARLKQFFRL